MARFDARLATEVESWIREGVISADQAARILDRYDVHRSWLSRLTAALSLVGGGLLLVGIALIGQIYNLSGRPADAVLLWWALLLPGAYVLPSSHRRVGRPDLN